MDKTQAYIVAAIGIIIPVLFIVFVYFLTRRGKGRAQMEGLFNSISGLQDELHSAFMERKKAAQK
jgi:hypothetical protein